MRFPALTEGGGHDIGQPIESEAASHDNDKASQDKASHI